jgi:phosphatidylserine/phosphatidylglycerophosphate/cardiolipin synthase-like enzyme
VKEGTIFLVHPQRMNRCKGKCYNHTTLHNSISMKKPRLTLPLLVRLIPFLLILVVASGCSPSAIDAQPRISVPVAEITATPAIFANGTIQVWFTHPGESGQGAGPTSAILDAIHSAQRSIDLAMYSFSQPEIAEALIQAKDLGVTVRMVMESDNMGKEVPRLLTKAGIPIIGDGGDGLMHNKFMVIDDNMVLLGSGNFTQTGLNEDNNYLLRVTDAGIADAFHEEFESMFAGGQFGSKDLTPTAGNDFSPGGTPVKVYFSPEDGVSNRLVALVTDADRSIHFLAYTFTLDDLGRQIIAEARKGVSVQGVFEGDMLPGSTGSEYDSLRRAGLDIRLDGNPALMHEKLFIIDGSLVVIGSYNFTRSADERNDENILIIHDPQLAGLFETEFNKVFEKGKP